VKVLKSEDDVSDVGNVGFSEDTTKPPADWSNEMGKVIVIGAQKIHDNNTNTNNLDFIFFHYSSQASLEPTQPTSPTPTENVI
jgi:hypothetical protein